MARTPDDLFGQADLSSEPLASRMRPRTIAEYIGQEHIMGQGRLLRRAIQADQLSSVIFAGPPGTGKTTLARVIANSTKSDFISLNAVLTGVADIREAIDQAQSRKSLHGRRTILFVDEVHRWNKAQQDALLPWVENGTFILIGATTENPYFEVNAALVSRSRVFQLKPLTGDDLRAIAAQALSDPIRGYGAYAVELEPAALRHLVETASGDARSLLNALELAVETSAPAWPPEPGAAWSIGLAVAEESIQQKALLYDRDGDYHYDSISAFIKSLRGSDPDAALYWLARMVRSGESPRFLFRRMMISASEDVGMADPQALVFVQNAAAAFDRVGLPEGQYFLAQSALYLATAPKSNSCLGYFDALKSLEGEALGEVPNHLKDGNRDKKGFGHGEGYLYPHAFRDHWVAQNYLPRALQGKLFYQPGELGFEGGLRPTVLARRDIQLASAAVEESAESLTWSPADQGLEHFARRSERGQERWLQELRDAILPDLGVARHQRLALVGAAAAFLAAPALRLAPEGLLYLAMDDEALALSRHQLEAAGLAERCRFEPLAAGAVPAAWSDGPPERIACVGLAGRWGDPAAGLAALASGAAPDCTLCLADALPGQGGRLSDFLADGRLDPELLAAVRAAEDRLYGSLPGPESWTAALAAGPWRPEAPRRLEIARRRRLGHATLEAWFASGRPGSYGSALAAAVGEAGLADFRAAARAALLDREVDWPVHYSIVRAALASPAADRA